MRYRLLIPLLFAAFVSTAHAQNERLLYGITFDGKTFDRLSLANGGNPILDYVLASDSTGASRYQLTG